MFWKDRTEERSRADRELARRSFIASLMFAVALALAALVWFAWSAFAQIFLGILWGIFMSELGRVLRRWLPVSHGFAVSLVLLAIVGSTVLAVGMSGKLMADELSQLTERLPESLGRLRDWAEENPQAKAVLERVASSKHQSMPVSEAVRGTGKAASAMIELGVAFFLVFFAGMFVAYSPVEYFMGLLRLFPARTRERAAAVMREIWKTLWLWTLGRVFVMTVIAVTHVVVYWLMGVPLAATLGLIAGVLSFIPNIGPIVATIPAVLVALSKSPMLAVWVVAAHAVTQNIENSILTPIVQRHAVEVPPLITVFSLMFFGLAMGTLGLVIATPLASVLLVLTRRLYIEGVLGETAESAKG